MPAKNELTRSWGRPFTAKRYLHGPFSEYMYTIWPEFMIMCGPVVEKTCGYRSSAFRVLRGKSFEPIDYRTTKTIPRADGIPVHVISNTYENLEITMEACCNTGVRVPNVFVKISLSNLAENKIGDMISILPRTGREDHLVGMEVDGYAHFDCNIHNFGFLPSKWRLQDNGYLTDGEYEIFFQVPESFSVSWQGQEKGLLWYQRNLLNISYSLNAKETVSFYLMMRPKREEPGIFDFDMEEEKACAFWNEQRKKIRHVPNCPEHLDVVYNLAFQCLQMFSYPVGKNYVLPRQGGLQRVIWPAEAEEFLVALDMLGDFSCYTKTAYDTFFNVCQKKDGEDKGAIFTTTGWACNSGAALWSCGHFLATIGTKEDFTRYRESMLLAFEWIQRKRKQSYDMDCLGKGIFPPMKSSDWPGEYQSWCITDCTNLEGIHWMANAFMRFKDPKADAVQREYDDYMICMKKILAEEEAKNTMQDEILITNKIGITLDDPPTGPYFDDGITNLLRVGVCDADSQTAHLAENYLRNRGCIQHGLTGLMNDGLIFQGHNADPWAGHTWYLSTTDQWWFETWLRQGKREKAKETLDAQLTYGMTDAYYLMERYADNDPYFVPWMPNASANGRMIQMLFEFYGSRDI